jgi:hypothetical protein
MEEILKIVCIYTLHFYYFYLTDPKVQNVINGNRMSKEATAGSLRASSN